MNEGGWIQQYRMYGGQGRQRGWPGETKLKDIEFYCVRYNHSGLFFPGSVYCSELEEEDAIDIRNACSRFIYA